MVAGARLWSRLVAVVAVIVAVSLPLALLYSSLYGWANAEEWSYGGAMACRISELVLDARDPQRLAAFWCEVRGFVVMESVGDSIEIGPPDTGFGGLQPTMVFSRNSEAKASKLRRRPA